MNEWLIYIYQVYEYIEIKAFIGHEELNPAYKPFGDGVRKVADRATECR